MNYFRIFGFALGLVTVSAFAAEPVSFALTPESCAGFQRALFPEAVVASESCAVAVLRPSAKEGKRTSPRNRIILRRAGKTSALPFGNSPIEAWGTRFEKTAFTVDGPLARRIYNAFHAQTRDLADVAPADSIWSRIGLCDPSGGTCLETDFLEETAGPDSSAEIACSRNTTLVRPSVVAIDGTLPKYDGHASSYIDDYVSAQIAAGDRRVDSITCSFLD